MGKLTTKEALRTSRSWCSLKSKLRSTRQLRTFEAELKNKLKFPFGKRNSFSQSVAAEATIRVRFDALIIHHTSYLPHTAQLCRAPRRFTELSHKAKLPVLQSSLPRPSPASLRALHQRRGSHRGHSLLKWDPFDEMWLRGCGAQWSGRTSASSRCSSKWRRAGRPAPADTGGFTPDRSCGASLYNSVWGFRLLKKPPQHRFWIHLMIFFFFSTDRLSWCENSENSKKCCQSPKWHIHVFSPNQTPTRHHGSK